MYKKLFCIKKRKNKETKMFINPLYKNGFDINIYLNSLKFDSSRIIDNKCCICYNNFCKCKNLCIPYQCNHLHCYECFKDYSLFCKKNNQIITCPLCRKEISFIWLNSPCIKFYYYKTISNKNVIFVLPF